MKSIRKIGKVALTGLAAIALTLTVPAGAFADSGGGVGGGSEGGSVPSGPYPWKSIGFDEPGKAWERFLKEDTRSDSWTTARVNDAFKRAGSKKSGEEICKSSKVIWYIERSDSRWHYNYPGNTYKSPGVNGTSILNPGTVIGRAPLQGELDAFLRWDAENGKHLNKAPGYTIVCSGSFMPDRKTPEIVTDGSEKPVSVDIKDVKTFTSPYSYVTQVTPMKNNEGGNIGSDKLHPQSSGETITNFGNLYNELNGANVDPNTLEKKVNAAINQDKNLDRAGVDLDEENKAGLAEGGILNVNENALNATISLQSYTTTVQKELCRWNEVWDPKANKGKGGYKRDPNSKTCRIVKEVRPVEYKAKVEQGTLQPTGFWQMLTVKCNQEELDALLSSDDTLIAKVEQADGSQSATIATKKYDITPSQLDFGDPQNSNAAKAATAKEGFFDKVCGLQCTPANSGPGASNDNGGKDNVGNEGNENNLYGAVSSGTNSNYFEFFRDNEDKTIRPDVWYPESVGNITYDGSAPKGTLVLRDSDGTPTLDGTEGGQFTMSYADDEPVFENKTGTVNVATGEKATLTRTSTASYRPGLYDEFKVRSTWASDPNKPQVFNFMWNYEAKISHTVPTGEIGFGPGGNAKTGDTESVVAPIEGFCLGEFGETENKDTSNYQNDLTDITGSGGTGFDEVLSDSDPAQEDSRNLVVNFVRSTGE